MPEDSLRSRMFSPAVPQGMVPPNQDMNYGVEIKAQPSLVEKIAKTIFDFKNPSIDPSILESAPAGIVLNPKNAEIIKNAIGKLPKDSPLLEQITAFMGAKYPKFTRLAEKIVRHPAVTEGPEKQYLGTWGEPDKAVNIYNEGMQSANKLTDTIAHELTHAYQIKRDPIGFNTSYMHPDDVGIDRYMQQSWERNARQGGDTAVKSLNKFARDYFPKLDATQHISKNPEFINEVVIPSWLDRYKSIEQGLATSTDPKTIKILQNDKEALKYNFDMLGKHLDPTFDPEANNRLPLTIGGVVGSLKNPNARGNLPTDSIEKFTPSLKDYLINKGLSGISSYQHGGFEMPAQTLDLTDIIRSALGTKPRFGSGTSNVIPIPK